MTIEETPFGIRNQVPASEKGWVYLERFVSLGRIGCRSDLSESRD